MFVFDKYRKCNSKINESIKSFRVNVSLCIHIWRCYAVVTICLSSIIEAIYCYESINNLCSPFPKSWTFQSESRNTAKMIRRKQNNRTKKKPTKIVKNKKKTTRTATIIKHIETLLSNYIFYDDDRYRCNIEQNHSLQQKIRETATCDWQAI